MRITSPVSPSLARGWMLGLLLASACAPTQAAVDDAPRVFTLRAEALQSARDGVRRGNPRLRPALERLVQEADSALGAGPFSVMDKQIVPPSGDKHDYISFGPYWWPDPDKPDGLPYIRRDGEVNPASKRDNDGERLDQLIDAVSTLGAAYYFTGDERYPRHASSLLRTWFLDPATRMNPHLEYGQAIPGRTEGRGIGIIDTRHLGTLVDAIGLIQPSEHWTEADQQGTVDWFRAYLHWLGTSKNGTDERDYFNNHGTWYDAQVVAMALFVGDTALARHTLERYTRARIASQIEPDGRQPHELARTRSLSYSTMNLEGFLRLAELGRHVGVDLWNYRTEDGRSLRRALDLLAPHADPANRWTGPQITPFDPVQLLPVLRMAAGAYAEPRYEALIARMPDPDRVAAHREQLLRPAHD